MIRRREFITLIGGAMVWPLAVRAQQPMPVIGFLETRMPETITERLRAFRQGLKETGYVEGENIRQSGSSCCAKCYRGLPVSPCSSIQPIPLTRRPRYTR